VIVAHIAGVPFEEWLSPMVATGGGMFLALRAVLVRRHRRSG